MAVVYRISCLGETIKETYIGSTMDFKQRMRHHKSCCHNENSKKYNVPLYKFIRENGGWGAWKMTIIDSLTTTDKKEIEKCERKYIDEHNFTLNIVKPTRTQKEHYQDHKEEKKQYQQAHKEEILEYKKQYREDHKEEISEKAKQWYKEHKEELCKKSKEYYEENKTLLMENKKQYYLGHREEIIEQKKLYREANREKIHKQQNEKIQCEKCGAFSTRSNLTRHQRSMRCMNSI